MLATHTPALFAEAVDRAAELLRAGEVVAIPTETVYGLAANALDARAVERIFAIKGRPAHNPIIVHVAGPEHIHQAVSEWPCAAEALARAFWPGPLTLVLPKSEVIPGAVTAGGSTVGIRWPAHPFAQAVIRVCGFPLAAPSANLAARTSPTRAEHVQRSLGGRIPLIVDGGPCQVGIESTVLDLTSNPPGILRPGMISAASLESVMGLMVTTSQSANTSRLISPGLLDHHYAPRAPLHVLAWNDDDDLIRQLNDHLEPAPAAPLANRATLVGRRICVLTHTRIPSVDRFRVVRVVPHDPEAFGRALYAELHRCDEAGADLIVVEAVPQTPPWRAIADRLRRASRGPA